MSTTTVLTGEQIQEIRELFEAGHSQRALALTYGVSRHTVQRVLNGEILESAAEPDRELIEQNVRLQKQKQRYQDLNRIERKAFREHARIENAVEALTEKLHEVFENHDLSDLTIQHDKASGVPCGVVHLSDLHFNEQIHLDSNLFNFDIAARRIRKHINRAKQVFSAMGVDTVLVALTGDLLNSDRRLDELLENATNRSKALFMAVDILQQAILDLNSEFNVFVASITGNEGRVNKDLGWVSDIASDNYDLVIHQTLKYLFRDSQGVTVLDIVDPLEQVVELNGVNFLLMHGHNGLANTTRITTDVSKVRSRYAQKGITIDYVLCGHIHQAFVSEFFARSGGLPGGNAYSEKALNLDSKASQNIYIVHPDKSIDGMKVCLQNVDGISAYKYDKSLDAQIERQYTVARNGSLVIHKVD